MERYDDINTPMVAVIGLVSVILTFALIVGIQVLYHNFEQAEVQRKVVDAPSLEADNLMAEQEAQLNRYGWIDREKGKVAIPIDRAMEFVVNELKTGRTKKELQDET